jgi:hypothetical protein
MHFSTWLWEQLDLPGRAGNLAKICWADVNNGCGNARFTGQEWLRHFDEKHKDKKEVLAKMLMPVYLDYLDEVDK